MDNVKNMRFALDYFIHSLPEFVENASALGSFTSYNKRMIIYRGNITPTLMKEWCKMTEEKTIPFRWGLLYDHHNEIYMNWKSRDGIIYITAEYNKSGNKGILELSWGIFELTPDVTITARQDGE